MYTLERCVKYCIYWTQCNVHFQRQHWAGLKSLDFSFQKWLARLCVLPLHFGWHDLDDTYSKGILRRRYSSSHGCKMIAKQEPSTTLKPRIRAVIVSVIQYYTISKLTTDNTMKTEKSTKHPFLQFHTKSSLTCQKLLQKLSSWAKDPSHYHTVCTELLTLN